MRALSILTATLLILSPIALADGHDPEPEDPDNSGSGSHDSKNETREDRNETDEDRDHDSSGPGNRRDRASGLAEACRDDDEPRQCAIDYCRDRADDDVCERVLKEYARARSAKAALEMCRSHADAHACEGLVDLQQAHQDARFLDFDVDREGKALVNYSISGRLLLEALQYGDDAEDFEVSRHGSQIRFKTDDSKLVVHDNPTGTFFFKSDDQELYLRFPESASIQTTEHGARIDYGGYRALLVGEDFEAFDHSIVLYGDAKFHSPVVDRTPGFDVAFEKGHMGGELRVGGDEDEIVAFDDVNITVEDGNGTEDDPIRVVFDADLQSGRTFVIDLDEDILVGDELDLRYYDIHDDGNETEVVFRMADSLADILDPTDDGGQPEYWIVEDENGVQVMVSVPVWSVHAIEIASVGEFLIQPSVVIGIVAGVAGVGVASLAMFRPRRDEDEF